MYQAVIPVTKEHDPIVIEGTIPVRVLLFNAGPATIRASVWSHWTGKENRSYEKNDLEPNFSLQLRPGNQKMVCGEFVRVSIDDVSVGNINQKDFAAVGVSFEVTSLI